MSSPETENCVELPKLGNKLFIKQLKICVENKLTWIIAGDDNDGSKHGQCFMVASNYSESSENKYCAR